jgi:hypothetical protein
MSISSWMLQSTLRLYGIAFERSFGMTFANMDCQCFELLCYNCGECQRYTTSAFDAPDAIMEGQRSHLEKENPSSSPLIVVTTDGKDLGSEANRYQACGPP